MAYHFKTLVIKPLVLTPSWFNFYASELQDVGYSCDMPHYLVNYFLHYTQKAVTSF